MKTGGGEELGPLLGEQAAYYQAIAAEYYDHALDLFWLSHVPPARFEPFWSLVADCLKPQDRVFFADDAYRTPDELVEGPSSPVIRRQLNNGTSYRLVKVPHQPDSLQEQLKRIGWHITVTPTAGPFYWGAGTRN